MGETGIITSLAPWRRRLAMTAVTLIPTVAALAVGVAVGAAGPVVGQPAPPFSTTDTDGRTVSLADLKGHTVVLEWTNHECPFVGRHYGSDQMQALQAAATADGVTWITVISSAPGEQGSVSAPEANQLTATQGAKPTDVVLDPEGVIGRAYGAKTTPHMFVIDPTGILVYDGAIDDQPRNAGADPGHARNYVKEALTAVKEGKVPAVTATQPYGCSVKYKG
ncbi:MAG: redoxin domain-containing protein [Rhodospirillales bacterium]